jgi:hypothetical protein
MRRIVATLLALGLVAALAPSAAGEPRFRTVWKDDAGDADMGTGESWGTPFGLDLVEGAIARQGRNLIFKVTMAEMPAFGSFPEFFRLLWTFRVNNRESFRLTIKRADVGKPYAGQVQTTERLGRADVDGHFRLEGDCYQEGNLVNCKPLAYLEGEWNPAEASVTMVVPMRAIGARPRSILSAADEGICGICWVGHFGERSPSPATVVDSAVWPRRYRVPRRG